MLWWGLTGDRDHEKKLGICIGFWSWLSGKQALDRMPGFKTQLSMYKMRIIIRVSTKGLL